MDVYVIHSNLTSFDWNSLGMKREDASGDLERKYVFVPIEIFFESNKNDLPCGRKRLTTKKIVSTARIQDDLMRKHA